MYKRKTVPRGDASRNNQTHPTHLVAVVWHNTSVVSNNCATRFPPICARRFRQGDGRASCAAYPPLPAVLRPLGLDRKVAPVTLNLPPGDLTP